jgi:hypothetical protein
MMKTALRLGEKAFTRDDQELFSRLSHDCNPMHMDPSAARRLITGRQVVHGMHVVLTALEYALNERDESVFIVDCSFNNPVSVDERVVFTRWDEPGQATSLEASVDGLVCARIMLGSALNAAAGATEVTSTASTSDQAIRHVDTLVRPLDEAPDSHDGKQYALWLDSTDMSAYFPQVHRRLGNERLVAMLALSYVVGMVCPGLHSVFSSFRLEVCKPAIDDGLFRFSVLKYDPRFRLFNIRFQAGIQGEIKAFQRPAAQNQPSLKDLSEHVAPQEFKGTKSLILGGSRGLGEVSAKLLAAGGGDTVLTYAVGLEDAKAVCDEINASGAATCEILKLDILRDSLDSLPIDWNSLDLIYFFPTSKIFRKKSAIFDARLYQEFSDFYVTRFYELCLFLEETLLDRKSKVQIYFPSTVAIDERPRGMAEYAMAKSAAEILIQEINRSFEKLHVSSSRLPRLNTDQTTSVARVSNGSNLEAMLPLTRLLQARAGVRSQCAGTNRQGVKGASPSQ